MNENESKINQNVEKPKRKKVTRVTDIDEVKRVFKRPKPSED